MNDKKKSQYTTFWMLIGNEWICAKDSADFTSRRSEARQLEKRTSHWIGSFYNGTTISPVGLYGSNKPPRKVAVTVRKTSKKRDS